MAINAVSGGGGQTYLLEIPHSTGPGSRHHALMPLLPSGVGPVVCPQRATEPLASTAPAAGGMPSEMRLYALDRLPRNASLKEA